MSSYCIEINLLAYKRKYYYANPQVHTYMAQCTLHHMYIYATMHTTSYINIDIFCTYILNMYMSADYTYRCQWQVSALLLSEHWQIFLVFRE